MKKRIESVWIKPYADIPSAWQAWLLHASSFMQRLAMYGVTDAHIQLVQQHWQHPEPKERMLLGLPILTSAWIREVLIVSEGKQWMFARTVIPPQTLTAQEQLMHLENRSLGSVLFKDPTLQRSEFEIAHLQLGQKWHAKVEQVTRCTLPDLWARRSLFSLQGNSLLLTEVFLPDIATL